MKNEPYIGLQAVSNFIGVNHVTLRNWLRDAPHKAPPAYRAGPGTTYRFRMSEVEAWIQANRITAN
ncbi:MAG: helix-turn-helix domain-containing protein [Fimbriimonadaceae bacterium]|nr:helix-turn-helix domain-containing protein [Alphaproteobacteria bacterium]